MLFLCGGCATAAAVQQTTLPRETATSEAEETKETASPRGLRRGKEKRQKISGGPNPLAEATTANSSPADEEEDQGEPGQTMIELRGPAARHIAEGLHRRGSVTLTLRKNECPPLTHEERVVETNVLSRLSDETKTLISSPASWYAVRRAVRGCWTMRKRVEEAVKSLEVVASVREANRLDALAINNDPIERIKCATALNQWRSIKVADYDAFGHPIIVETASESLKRFDDVDLSDAQVLTGRVYCTEMLTALKQLTSTEHMKVTKHVYVIDFAGVRMGMLSGRVRRRFKAMCLLLEQAYPDTVYRTYCVNAPTALDLVWKLVSYWLHPTTRDKIRILRCDDVANRNAFRKDGVPERALDAVCGLSSETHALADIFVGGDDNKGPVVPTSRRADDVYVSVDATPIDHLPTKKQPTHKKTLEGNKLGNLSEEQQAASSASSTTKKGNNVLLPVAALVIAAPFVVGYVIAAATGSDELLLRPWRALLQHAMVVVDAPPLGDGGSPMGLSQGVVGLVLQQ